MSENFTKNNEAKTFSKQWELDVSDEQYEASKAKGLDEETLFKPGKHIFRRRDPNKIVKKENKTVILHLDSETFDFYKRRAENENIESVELQIEAELRVIAEKEAA